MTTNKSFTAAGNGLDHVAREGERVVYVVSGTFVGTVVFEQRIKGNWSPIATATAGASGTFLAAGQDGRLVRYRFRCSAFTSGTIVTSITNETTVALGPVVASAVDFIESVVAGVFTGAVALPANATLIDIIIDAIAQWDSETSATMIVGDAADPDGYFAAVNLKATDLLVGESLSFAQSGGKAGAYNAGTNTHWTTRSGAAARVISGVITKVGATGSAGRTRMTVVYAPAIVNPTIATKA